MRHAEFVMGTADSISFGRGGREHDEREPVLSRLHYGHHARFIRTGSRCCVIGSKFTNTRLIRSLMSLSRRRQIDRLSRGSAMSFPAE